jgi:peptidoglycan/LPS O-acetylase OafA/YrhL
MDPTQIKDIVPPPVALAESREPTPALEDLKTGHGLRRLHYIDGLRAFAALWVILFHGWQPDTLLARTPILGLILRFLTQGQLPVLIFLVLSGFCLYYPLVLKNPIQPQMAISYGAFIIRRARRILPPFYTAMAVCLLAVAVLPRMNRAGTHEGWGDALPVTGRSVLTHLLLIHNLSSLDWKKIDYPAWTIGLEWQLYLLFPLFVWLFRFGSPALPVALAAAVTLATRVASRILHGSLGFALDWGPLNYCLVFVAGMAAAQYTVRGISPRVPRWSLGLVALLSFGFVFYRGLHGSGLETGAFLFVPVGMVCLLLLAAEPKSFIHRVFSASWLVTVGVFSYSIYLLHAPILHFFLAWPLLNTLSPDARFAVVCFVVTPAIVALSYLFFLVFERPFIGAPRRKDA